MAGSESSIQFIGGLVVALLYVVIGLLGAIGSIFIFRRIFQGRWEQIFWAFFLVMIAAFYLSFAAYFEASTHAWQTEVIGVAVFLVCAGVGLFFRPVIAVGYVMHGIWDLSHCLSGSSLAGPSLTEIPLGYGLFCSAYDLPVAGYVMIGDTAWHESGKFDLLERGLLYSMAGPGGRQIPQVNTGVRIDGAANAPHRPPPALAGHGPEILRSVLNKTDEEIARLRAAGIV